MGTANKCLCIPLHVIEANERNKAPTLQEVVDVNQVPILAVFDTPSTST